MMGNCKSLKKAINSLILVLLWILFSNAHLSAKKLLIYELLEEAAPCVVRINIYDKTGSFWNYGMGFFIAPGKILTCAHVMKDAYSAQVISSIRTYNRLKILKVDEDRNLALLMINASGEKSLPLENKQVPVRKQYLIAIGYNYAMKRNSVSYGFVYEVVSHEGIQRIVNSVPISPGGSGGPLLNFKGHVVGVHEISRGDGQKVAFSAGIKTIKKFLERPNNPRELDYAGSSVLWCIILEKLGEFWGKISGWIANSVRGIIELIFIHGALRGVFIIILAGILIGWRSKILYRFVRAWKRRKAINKIIKWSNGYSSLEIRSVLETRANKGKYHLLIDGRVKEIVLD